MSSLSASFPRLRRADARELFTEIFDKSLRDTRVDFVLPDSHVIAGQRSRPADYSVNVADPRFFARVIAFGSLGLGESYMDGWFELARGRLEDWLTVLLRSRLDLAVRGDFRLSSRALALRVVAHLRGQAASVRSHYDLGDDLFESFLDSTLSYSCGYARSEADSLDQLQHNKLERICQKLRLGPDMCLLDVGCGFGGLLMHAARNYGVSAVGITNSLRHAAIAAERVAAAGLSSRIRIESGDYRSVQGTFDRVVSVGMLEHVHPRDYQSYFDCLSQRLGARGVALVHCIGCNAARNEHDPFIQKYIFPGSHQPRLSQLAHHAERSGLAIADLENMARHYALTIRGWLHRFRANRHTLDAKRYDARFQRMWEFYLCAGMAAGEASDSALYQLLLQRDARDPMPLART